MSFRATTRNSGGCFYSGYRLEFIENFSMSRYDEKMRFLARSGMTDRAETPLHYEAAAR
jgi:hypothetical protein